MKKKKVKKLAMALRDQITKYNRRGSELKAIEEEIEWSEHDSDVSDKFKKMIFNLLNYRENIKLQIYDNSFNITSEDVSLIKNKRNHTTLYAEENHLRIDVSRTGFQITKGYSKRSNYKDEKIFDELIDYVKSSQKKYNSDNFIEIWSDVMKDSGLSRDNNLDQLFDEK